MTIDLSPELLKNFIVFEGIDGSGQDTQAGLFRDYLKSLGYKVWLTSEPSKDLSSLGVTIRYILANEPSFPAASLQLLMVADRAMHVEQIRKHLSEGYVVITVRYLYTTLSYGFLEGLDINWLIAINRTFPRPQAMFYLDLPANQALARVISRSEKTGRPLDRFETLEKLDAGRRAFADLASLCPEMKLVDASGTPEEIAERIRGLANLDLGIETQSQKPLDLFV